MSDTATPAPSLLEQRAIRKITRRLIPFLMLLYFVAFLDRINVGFAALTMNQRTRPDVQDVQHRLGHFLRWLLRLRGPLHHHPAQGRSALLDRPRHDHLGPGLDRHGFHPRPHQLLCPPLSARPRGSRLLPRNHPVSQLLVSRESSLGCHCDVYGGRAGRRTHRLARLRRLDAAQRPARSAWMAMAFPRRRRSRAGAGPGHPPLPHRPSCRRRVARRRTSATGFRSAISEEQAGIEDPRSHSPGAPWQTGRSSRSRSPTSAPLPGSTPSASGLRSSSRPRLLRPSQSASSSPSPTSSPSLAWSSGRATPTAPASVTGTPQSRALSVLSEWRLPLAQALLRFSPSPDSRLPRSVSAPLSRPCGACPQPSLPAPLPPLPSDSSTHSAPWAASSDPT